jgi:hypothetical protein
VGAPVVKGTAEFTFRIQGAGADIWETADQFRFVYQPFTGDGEIVARVTSLGATDPWAKAGVMFRESLTPDSPHAFVMISAQNGYGFQRRPTPRGGSLHTPGGIGGAPGWVRLVRRGDVFEAYRSLDGGTWSRVGSDTIPMGDTVYVGLAVTSHNTGVATTATVDSVTVTSNASTNQPPAVTLTQPINGSQVTSPAVVTIAASASDPENRLASVEFYVEGTLIGTDTSPPYSASWTASTGTYLLRAVARDADGGTTSSNAVSVTVSANANRAPTVTLTSPASGATFTAPATIALAANASDPDGAIARVDFYSGTSLLGTDSASPFSYNWSGPPAGSYSLTAMAYDTAGMSATSPSVSISVGTPPPAAPTAAVFTVSIDHATNVTSYLLSVYASNANPATATPIAQSDLGKPTPAANNDITVNRASFFAALPVGNYLATVTAIGPGGQTRSTSVAFSR